NYLKPAGELKAYTLYPQRLHLEGSSTLKSRWSQKSPLTMLSPRQRAYYKNGVIDTHIYVSR
ncbi:MAG: hypothetical protein RR341_05355, partial [Bacteroidales bacterium]